MQELVDELGEGHWSWPEIAQRLGTGRTAASVERKWNALLAAPDADAGDDTPPNKRYRGAPVKVRTKGGREAIVLEKMQRGWFRVELDQNANDEGGAYERKTLRRPMFAPGQDELLNSAPPDPNPAEPKPKDPAAPKKSPAKAAAAAPADKAAKKPSSKPSVRKPSSARPLSSSSVPVAAVIPADTPQGLAACFAAFYPGSKAEDKAKFQQFVLDNTLCPRHVLNMPVEKCESMLQQQGFEGVVVFTFQSRLREAFAPPPTAYVPSPAPIEETSPAPYVPPIVAAAVPPPGATPAPAAALGQH